MAKDNSKPAAEPEKVETAPPATEPEKVEAAAPAVDDDVPGAGPNEVGAVDETTVDEVEPEQSVEAACAELNLAIEEGGTVKIEMLTGLSGPDIGLVKGDPHECDAAEAVRLVRAGFAQPR